jgi:hypothetical protein
MISVVMRKSSVIRSAAEAPFLDGTVYMLERSVAKTLGHPYCATDREIDVELPANVSDEIENEGELITAIERASQFPYRITTLSPTIHSSSPTNRIQNTSNII